MKSSSASIHPDFLAAQRLAYELCGLTIKNLIQEIESKEYGAYEFEMNNRRIKFRVAKITPTKTGQFVTLWKRIGNGPIMPYDKADPVDIFVVTVRNGKNFGQFVFPKDVLWKKGYVSENGNGGKRAMRVYPPWDITDSPQAKKTQAWQLLYLVEIEPTMDISNTQRLFSL